MTVTEIVSPHGPLPHIPDDVTIPQFLLDSWHPVRPVKKHLTPWFIDDDSQGSVNLRSSTLTEDWLCSNNVTVIDATGGMTTAQGLQLEVVTGHMTYDVVTYKARPHVH